MNEFLTSVPPVGIEYITVVEGNAEIGTLITLAFLSEDRAGGYLGDSCCMWNFALLWNSGGNCRK